MTASESVVTLTALSGIPRVQPGDDLAVLLGDALDYNKLTLCDQDILVVSHKIVSKAEGRYVSLNRVTPSAQAQRLALETEKDPALVELILSESRAILRQRPGLIIAEHRLGMVMANAGIDQSNVDDDGAGPRVLLLPQDPDGSSATLRQALHQRLGIDLGIIIADSAGRAWRHGVIGMALGVAGLPALVDLRGKPDLQGRPLAVSHTGFADQIASAAELLMGEAAEGRPVVVIHGLSWQEQANPASDLIRTDAEDLFR
ncbi:MAG: coenzyme F420-0:L-glutamate ligase [Acidiferrobacteraceae bacterium]|nr:coenzyme F420-0:L-glutamate ligase [Acidiferrobacteraceae bacterium]MCP4828424.1 coenzyme F420-0:L-glutamate ligase [Pseudomonadota bacterium]MDP6950446.1 coenzyme F420-0:L-glutamate ligase [Arenicellales bacterium]HJP07810.1 coenzyme F420-0:L-glutamate ligase [Arenicellales bacterium]